MEMDMTGLWTWTLPLWGLGALIFFLTVIFNSPAQILTHVPGIISDPGTGTGTGTGQGGGSRSSNSNSRGKSRIH